MQSTILIFLVLAALAICALLTVAIVIGVILLIKNGKKKGEEKIVEFE